MGLLLSGPVGSVQRPPSDPTALLREGEARLRAGEVEAAKAAFEEALDQGLEAPALTGLGRCLLAKGHQAYEAILLFRRAQRADPDYLPAYYYLARAFLRIGGWDAEEQATRVLLEIVRRAPSYRDALPLLLRLRLSPEESRELVGLFGERLDRSPEDDEAAYALFLLLEDLGDGEALQRLAERLEVSSSARGALQLLTLARIRMGDGEVGAGTELYLAALDAARTGEELARFWEAVQWLIGEEAASTMRELPVDQQKDSLRVIWKTRDPTPTTQENERLAEQESRERFARAHFRRPHPYTVRLWTMMDLNPSPRGFPYDDRGLIFLRHGKPDVRLSVGTVPHLDTFARSPFASPQESWIYRGEGGAFLVHLHPGRGVADYRMAQRASPETYSYLASYLPVYAYLSLHYDSQGSVEWQDFDFHQERSLVREMGKVLLESDSYAHDYGRLLFASDLIAPRFKGQDGRSELALFVRPQGGRGPYRATLVVFDEAWREVDRLAERPLHETAHGPLGLLGTTSQQGTYYWAIRVESVDGSGLGVYKGEVALPAFGEAGLDLSDLVLAEELEPDAEAGPFRRQGWRVLARPDRRFRLSEPLGLYYEIYGLAPDQSDRVAYRAEYTVEGLQSGSGLATLLRPLGQLIGVSSEPGATTLTVERQLRLEGDRVADGLLLDLNDLQPGRYRVRTVIRDLTTQAEAAREATFEIVEEEE